MKKILGILIGIFVLVALGAVGAAYYFLNDSDPESVIQNSTPTPTIKVSYVNFAEIISKNYVIKELPENAVIQLKFFNFDSGSQTWEKSFIMKRANVQEGNIDSADITLTLHSKYLKELTDKNFCDVIKKANSNGDLGFESSMSTTALAWKFKSIMKYKSCFGL
jgi:hypothetical protein